MEDQRDDFQLDASRDLNILQTVISEILIVCKKGVLSYCAFIRSLNVTTAYAVCYLALFSIINAIVVQVALQPCSNEL